MNMLFLDITGAVHLMVAANLTAAVVVTTKARFN
jgi:hypothetical protein